MTFEDVDLSEFDDPPDFPEMTPDESIYYQHNEHHECFCDVCERYRESMR